MKKKTFKNTLAVALLSCAALGASVVHAAENQSYTINLTATVPAHTFQVDPADSGWITQTQTMEFDATSRTLKPFEKQFQYKSTAGAIQAKLTGKLAMGRAMISSGSNGIVIPLNVKFNNTDLTNTTTTVVTAAAAKTGGTATLHIAPDSGAELTEGTYTGSVAMIFEPVVD